MHQKYQAELLVVDLKAITSDYCVACDSIELTRQPMRTYIPSMLSFLFTMNPERSAEGMRVWLHELEAFDNQNYAVEAFIELTVQYLKNIEAELNQLGINSHDGDNNYFVAKCTREFSVYICTDPLGDRYRSSTLPPALAFH